MSVANFGLVENSNPQMSDLTQRVSNLLARISENIGSVEIKTYTSAGIADNVSITGTAVQGATLHAVTSLSIDGDINNILPITSDGEIDQTISEIHQRYVQLAIDYQVQLVGVLAKLVANQKNP